MAGAPIGNNNRQKGALVRGAIRRALAENEAQGRESLLNIARKMIQEAEGGDLAMARELFDRLEGTPVRTTEVTMDATVTTGLAPVYGIQPPAED